MIEIHAWLTINLCTVTSSVTDLTDDQLLEILSFKYKKPWLFKYLLLFYKTLRMVCVNTNFSVKKKLQKKTDRNSKHENTHMIQ